MNKTHVKTITAKEAKQYFENEMHYEARYTSKGKDSPIKVTYVCFGEHKKGDCLLVNSYAPGNKSMGTMVIIGKILINKESKLGKVLVAK